SACSCCLLSLELPFGPAFVVVVVLRHFELTQLLGLCNLVCTEWAITLNRDPFHETTLRIVVMDRGMLNRAIVPEHHRVGFPVVPVLMFQDGSCSKEPVEQHPAFLLLQTLDEAGVVRVDKQNLPAGHRVDTYYRMAHGRIALLATQQLALAFFSVWKQIFEGGEVVHRLESGEKFLQPLG